METNELKGLLAIWTDIDKDYLPHFREWHSKEHMVLRIPTPGWYVGHRYYGLEGAPGFLISYETSEASDLAGKSYHQSLNRPDARTEEALGHYRNSVRTIYRLLKGAGEALPTDAPFYSTIRFNVGGKETITRLAEEHLPSVCRIPGVRRARLYEVDEEISHIMTEERKLYGAGPGKQKYLATYELSSPDIIKSAAWKETFAGPGKAAIPGMKIDYQDLFALEFTIYSPHVRHGMDKD